MSPGARTLALEWRAVGTCWPKSRMFVRGWSLLGAIGFTLGGQAAYYRGNSAEGV